MGGAIEGAVPCRRLALLVLGSIFPAQSAASATISSGGNSYLQHGIIISRPSYSARLPHESAVLADPYGFVDDGAGWSSPRQVPNSELDDAQTFSFELDDVKEPEVPSQSGMASRAGKPFRGPRGATSGRRKADGYRTVSALQLADQLKEDGGDSNAESKSSNDSKESPEDEEQQNESSQSSQEGESSTTNNEENEKATSAASGGGPAADSPQAIKEEAASSGDSTPQAEPKNSTVKKESNTAEPNEEEKEDEEEEPAEGNSQAGKASSSENQASTSEQQAAAGSQAASASVPPAAEGEGGASAKATSAPVEGGTQAASDKRSESASESNEAEGKSQTDEDPENAKSEPPSGSAEAKPQVDEEDEGGKGESTASLSAAEGKPQTNEEPESEKAESTSERREAEGQPHPGKEADNEKGESTSEATASQGSPQSSKESEAERSEAAPSAPQHQIEKSTEAAGEQQKAEGSEGESVPSTTAGLTSQEPGGAPQPSQEAESRPAAAEASPQAVPQQQQQGRTEAESKGAVAGKAEEGPPRGSAAVPAEESGPEGVEGITKGDVPASAGESKCYSDIAQEAFREEEALRKNAATNVHFQEAEQQFCDEIFRRIDGPYSLAELSALLRAADIANSLRRNFRYCRATPTSSPPRVKDGDSILHAAISARKPHVTEVLLQYGAFPELPAIPQSQTQPVENTAFPLASANVEVLASRGSVDDLAFSNLEQVDPPRHLCNPVRHLVDLQSANARPIHIAAVIQALDSIESMELLLHYGANANSRDKLGRTPLMLAAYHPKPHSHEFVKKLILSGAEVNATDKAGLNALHYAAASDNWQVVRVLLDHGADPTAADIRGNTPLHYGAAFNSFTATTKLLEKGNGVININMPNANGKAPIHLAAAPHSFQAVPRAIVPALALEALLNHHANPMARDPDGNNPLHLAALGGYVEILRRLVSFTQIPADEKNAAGLTPLAAAQKAIQGPVITEVEHFLQVYGEKKSCIEPPVVRHSTRMFSDTVLGPYMRVGDTVTYACNPGFQLYGHSTIICQERDGKMEFVPDPPLCNLQTVPSSASPGLLPPGPIAIFALVAALAWYS